MMSASFEAKYELMLMTFADSSKSKRRAESYISAGCPYSLADQ
jgi:hypothetical protein